MLCCVGTQAYPQILWTCLWKSPGQPTQVLVAKGNRRHKTKHGTPLPVRRVQNCVYRNRPGCQATRTIHQGLFVSNRSMICCFSLDVTLGGVMPPGPIVPVAPLASLAAPAGTPESMPIAETKPAPGVTSE